MKINLLLFGITKEIAGTSNLKLEVPSGATVAELKEILIQHNPEMQKLKSLMIAVNQQYASPERTIAEEDEIAVIPPVSGG